MARYSLQRLDASTPVENFNEAGWHEDLATTIRVYRNPDTGDVVLYVVEHD